MKQLTKSEYNKSGATYKSVGSPINNSSQKQIDSVIEENGVFKYKTDGEYKNVGGGTVIQDYNGNKITNAKFEGTESINVDLKDGDPETFSFRVDSTILNAITGLSENVNTINDNIETINTTLGDKADTTYVDDSLSAKANTLYVNDELSKKANDNDVVKLTEQTLTEEQKTQAKTNIGVVDFSGSFNDLINVPNASESTKGIIQIASSSETASGTDNTKAITPALLKQELAKFGNIFDLKGEKATKNDLPTTNNKKGDVWFVKSESVGYIWLKDTPNGTVSDWEKFGEEIDLSGYIKFTDVVNSLVGTETDKPLSAYQGNVLYGLDSQKVVKENGKSLVADTEITKLATVKENAEPNVQSDWNETNSGSDSYIKNKPTIPKEVKLYDTTGQNTDGAINQKVVTDNLENKVDKVSGKGLSTNDFTTAFKDQITTNKNDISNLQTGKYDKSGGAISGAISATGNVSGNYIIGNWLQSKGTSNLGSGTFDVPVLRSDGWIYKRTKDEFLADTGAIKNTSYAQPTVGGTLKARFDSATGTLYLTNDGTDA